MENNRLSTIFNNAKNDATIIVAFALAILFALSGIISDNKYFEGLMTIFVGFSVGYSVNRYTEMFRSKTEIGILAEKVAEDLFAMVKEIVDESHDKKLTPEDYQTVSQLCKVIKSLEKYHKIDLEPFRGQYKIRIDEGKLFYRTHSTGSFNETPLEAMDKVFYHLGDAKHTESSGSHWRATFQQLQQGNSGSKFMGSGGLTNEPTFKSPDNPEKT